VGIPKVFGIIALLVLLSCLAPLTSHAAVIDSFERGDEVGWSLVGDGNHMADFSMHSVSARAPPA